MMSRNIDLSKKLKIKIIFSLQMVYRSNVQRHAYCLAQLLCSTICSSSVTLRLNEIGLKLSTLYNIAQNTVHRFRIEA